MSATGNKASANEGKEEPRWYEGISNDAKKRLMGITAIDEELEPTPSMHVFGLIHAGPSKEMKAMEKDLYSDEATTDSRVETLIQTVKRLEAEGRERDVQLAEAISANEIRAAAAMDGAAYAHRTAVESGNAANDASRCYSKQCLVFSGEHMPARLERLEDDDGPKHLIEKIVTPLLGIQIDVNEIAVAHYMRRTGKTTDMIARFTRQAPGSAYVRCLNASRALSVKNQDKTVTRKVKIWARINESGLDAHISYLLRQMVKAGQATGISVGMGGRVSAMVKYGNSREEFRRLQFSTVSDVREVMNRASREQEKKSDAQNGARRAETQFDMQQGMGMFKLAMHSTAKQKFEYPRALDNEGKYAMLSEALRVGIGMDNEDKLKYLTWKGGPNSAFGIMTGQAKEKESKKRAAPGDNGNDAQVRAPKKKHQSVNLDPALVTKRLQILAEESGLSNVMKQ
jgi:hypothetical protein